MRCVLHLDLMQHCDGPYTPSVLHGVQRHEWVRLLLLLLSLLSLLSLLPLLFVVSLLPPLLILSLRLLFQAVSTVDKALGSPLHLIQQGEVGLGTALPAEGTVLHDGPHLRLVQRHEARGIE